MVYVFLQEGYDPKPDPNSICTQKLVNELKSKGHTVYVICDGPAEFKKSFSSSDFILHVPCHYQTSFRNSSLNKKIAIVLNRVAVLPNWPIRFPNKVKKYISAFGALIEEKKLQEKEITVISVYRPAEMVEVGYKLKKRFPAIKFIIYNLDGLETNVDFMFRSIFNRIEQRWQLSRYNLADKIFQMNAHKEYYLSSDFKANVRKTLFVDYPLIEKNIYISNEKCDCSKYLYSGSFYKGLREPYYMIEWFKKISKNIDSLSIYTRNDFVDYIEEEAKKSRNKISRYDYVSSDEMNHIIAESSVLVSIGNTSSKMVPSKLFVYMASCKIIVHFFADESDSCLPYLLRYPKSILLDTRKSIEENVEISLKKIREFSDAKSDYDKDYLDISNRFYQCCPRYTVELLCSDQITG